MSLGVRAPELEPNRGWLNTNQALRFSDELRGRVVVLDFWTYCCINCIHILPDLAFLEDKYAAEPVQFIGVHSAKFTNEASTETIRAAILRYEIKHPVVVDEGMKIWRQYAVRSWPTLVVIDPRGHVVGAVAGEGNRDVLDNAIAQALAQGRANGTLAPGPLALRREGMVRSTSGLAFPGKVFADERARHLFVADSNHNRIILADWPDERGHAKVIQVVGRGTVGREDGPPRRASFHHPQGLAAAHGKLYVADTENHLIRAIDLSTFHVTTVCGTGDMSNDRAGGGMGTEQGLNSPWDLAIEGSTLYVAMAGTHQIWRIDLPVGFARALAGSGRENIVDGPTETAALAQPSGLCLLGGNIYFADSEVSAIRGIDMAAERVFTVVGEGLFSFGDVDGTYPAARLQHPLGVTAWKSTLLVADTYNHKIKAVDPGARSVRTVFGSGRPGTVAADGGPAFFDPGGLHVAGDELFVADTNNHRIVRVNLVTKVWHEVVIEGLEAREDIDADTSIVDLGEMSLACGRDVELIVDVELPPEAHFAAEAPWSIRVRAGEHTLLQRTGQSRSLPLTAIIPADSVDGDTEWHVTASFAYCTDGVGSVCIPARLDWRVRVANRGGDGRLVIQGAIS
jgi:thiol-disulfide isomerase/thioredoxin